MGALCYTMAERFMFTSESVNEGHPDKLCDQVSDAVVDAYFAQDPKSHVACETCTGTNFVMVFGEITSSAKVDVEKVVRDAVKEIGFDAPEKGLDYKTFEFFNRLHGQSAEIANAVHGGDSEKAGDKKPEEVGAGDQGHMFGYASDETPEMMPLTHSLATGIGYQLTKVRKNGTCAKLRPDGKTQVTCEYEKQADGSLKPLRVHTIVISTQHDGDYMQEQLKKDLMQHVITPVVPAKYLDDKTIYHLNPSGSFIIGGPQGDAGLTGRKIIIDTYGGWGAHGGGAFSGKDPTKVDRSAAYICRQMAKSVVKGGLSKRCLVQLSYAIGVAKPLSLFVETYGTECGGLTPDDITNVLKIEFDCRPGAIAQSLALREPKYKVTAAYCHFGRQPYTENGIKYFEWENAKDLTKYAPMSSAQVGAALAASNYLTKYVD